MVLYFPSKSLDFFSSLRVRSCSLSKIIGISTLQIEENINLLLQHFHM